MHLHLVGPPDAGQDPPTRKRRRGPSSALSLSTEEGRHLRAFIRGIIRTRYGTLAKLAAALHVDTSALTRKSRPGPGLAVAVWRLSGTPLEVILRGGIAAVPAAPLPRDTGGVA